MIVITVTNCPASLRGDLTKWLLEISAGVFVGQVSARVRDNIWERIKENVKTGKAIMVFSAKNEQRLSFKVHNHDWEPIDFDGIKLILRPSPSRLKKLNEPQYGFSNAAKHQMAKHQARKARSRSSVTQYPDSYVVVDVETTGLSPVDDEIIEIGAIKVVDKEEIAEYSALIKIDIAVPLRIAKLTGISTELLQEKGRDMVAVMAEFLEFISELPLVAHNATFDLGFIHDSCSKCGLEMGSNRVIDTLPLARKVVADVGDYKLQTLAKHFNINITDKPHRVIQDCRTTKLLFENLMNCDIIGRRI
jgi:CRISPR-associated protein Cas2